MTPILVETERSEPITLEILEQEGERVFPCLVARDAHWRYSLLSSDRHRMICLFDAPDVEAVRMSYHKASVGFEKMWTDQILQPNGSSPTWQEPMLTAAESRYPDGLTDEQWQTVTQHLLPFLAEQGIEWVRSHVSPDKTLVIHELNAPDPDLIWDAHRQLQVPLDRVWSAALMKP